MRKRLDFTRRTAHSLLLVLSMTLSPPSQAEHPPLQPYDGDTAEWGRHLQRTMGLLAESTPEHRHAVKIL